MELTVPATTLDKQSRFYYTYVIIGYISKFELHKLCIHVYPDVK